MKSKKPAIATQWDLFPYSECWLPPSDLEILYLADGSFRVRDLAFAKPVLSKLKRKCKTLRKFRQS